MNEFQLGIMEKTWNEEKMNSLIAPFCTKYFLINTSTDKNIYKFNKIKK